MVGVALVCFTLVHLAPGDPLVSVLPPDASAELQERMREMYGFNRSYPEQFANWVWRALQGDLESVSVASGRPVADEVMRAVGNTLRLAVLATFIGFILGSLFGFVAGCCNSWVDKAASLTSVLGVSVPHYWLGMVLVIVFSVLLNWMPPGGARPGGSTPVDLGLGAHAAHGAAAVTMSVIPMGIIARTVHARWWPRSCRRSSSSACVPRASRTSASSCTW